MFQTLPNPSKPHSHASPPRSNRFSCESASHQDQDHSYSRSRSIEFSPTSLKRSHFSSSNSQQKPSLDPRDPRLRLQRTSPPRSPPKIQAHQHHRLDYAPKRFSKGDEIEENDFKKKAETQISEADPRLRLHKAGHQRSPPRVQTHNHHLDDVPKRFSSKVEEDDFIRKAEAPFEAKMTETDPRLRLHKFDHRRSPSKAQVQPHHLDYTSKRFSKDTEIEEDDLPKKVETRTEAKMIEADPSLCLYKVDHQGSPPKVQVHHPINKKFPNAKIICMEEDDFLKRAETPSETRRAETDPRLRLQKVDHQRPAPKILVHRLDYAPKKFSEKIEEDDYWKKVEPQCETRIVTEIEQDQETDNVSTNSSEKSTSQSEVKIELTDSKIFLISFNIFIGSVEEPDSRKRDPRLVKKAFVCPNQTKGGMEAEIGAIFNDKGEDEKPAKILDLRKVEEPVIIFPQKRDEEPESQKKSPMTIDIEDDGDEEEQVGEDKEPFLATKTEFEEEEEEDKCDDEILAQVLLQESIGADPRKRLQKPRTFTNKKLNLVLDLDETLINSHTVTQDFDIKQIKNIPQDQLKIMENGALKTIIVTRPYTKEFLERVSKHYNLYVYSHGRYDYVQFALEIIDKNQQYISREKIFKNCGQVNGGTRKRLSNLGLSQEEINKTIILDDQRQIWEYEHLQVICSKKFIPLKDFIKEEKYSRYLLFRAKQYEKNWLSSQNNHTELDFYCETHASFSTQRLGQLELLAHFFERIAKDHEKTAENSPDIRIQELCEARMKAILKGMKIGITSSCLKRREMFEGVAEILGATVTENSKAHYLVLDHNVSDDEKKLIKGLSEEKPMVIVVTVAWLLECFFRLAKVSTMNYLQKL